jgi:FkbM family methyltransferase
MTFRRLALRSSLLVGRRNVYRLSRFLIMGARGDVPNDPRTNGELLVQEIAMKLALSPAVVIDVGANRGDWTASLLNRSNGIKVTVHAFEPCRETYELLARRTRESAWSNVLAVQQACSRSPGAAKMSVHGPGAGTNTLAELIEPANVTVEDVGLTSIDAYCRTNGVKYVDLLKIDAEGWDFEVIAGASQMLGKHLIRLLQFEYNRRWIGARNYLRDAFLLLSPMGYKIGKLVGNAVEFYPRWHWELETYREGNYLACTEEVAARFPQRRPNWLRDL